MKVFVLDDNPDEILLMTHLFRVNDLCEAEFFTDPYKLLNTIKEGNIPDLVVTDLYMDFNIEGMTIIYKMVHEQKIPVIATSGSGEDLDTAVELGALAGLEKEPGYKNLLQTIKQFRESTASHRVEDAETSKTLILVIDDDPQFASVISKYLNRECPKFTTVASTTVLDAFNFLKTNRVALIISDVLMPYYDGIELAECVAKRHAHIPVIFISSDPFYASVALDVAQRHGSRHVEAMYKPIDLPSLKSSMHSLIQSSNCAN